MVALRSRLQRMLGRSGLVAALAGVVLLLFEWWPMIGSYPRTPGFDGRYPFQQFEIARASLRYYGEISLWNPFDCRGIPMWDFPESMTSSPLFFATAPFDDTLVTLYVWNLAHAIAGYFAMWLLARRGFALGMLASFVAAAMWSAGAWHAVQCAGHHETFVSFYLVPLFLYLWRRAEEHHEAAVLAGLLLAWMVYDGGTYAVPFSVVVLGIETLTRLRSRKRVARIALAALVAGVVALAVGASRLLPLAEQFAAHRRNLPPDTDHMLRATTLFATFFYRGPADPAGQVLPGQQYGFDEYVIYFGPLGVLLSVIGAALAWKKHRWTLLVASVIAVLALGHFAPWAPWTFLQRHVFPFTSMRVSSRFVLMLAMFMCIWMALAVDELGPRVATWTKQTRWPRVAHGVAVALALGAVLDTAAWGRSVVAKRFLGDPLATVTVSPRFFYGFDDAQHPDFLNHPRQNRAYVYCRASSFAFHRDAPIWTGDVPQAMAATEGVTVSRVSRTHNTFSLEVDATQRARIRLNSAHDRGWQSSVGEVVEDEQLLALWVEPGHHVIHMRYWPRTLTMGIVLSALGLVGAALFLSRAWIARRVLRRSA